MTRITTSAGKTFECTFIGVPLRAVDRLIFEVKDDRKLSEVAADFENSGTITRVDDLRPNEENVYKGYTHIKDISDGAEIGTYRLILEQPKE